MSMYFVQHGLAVDKAENPSRPLSEKGTLYVNKVASHLSGFDLSIKQVFHSGKERAEQTARLFAAALDISQINLHQYLNPNDDVNQVIPLLEDNSMYVGHLPHMEKLVSKLLCGDDDAELVEFENSAVICVDRKESGYRLQWMIRASML